MIKPAKHWIPSRKEVIWMDCNPQVGREMKDMHPFLVFCHQPKSFDWRARRAKPHPLAWRIGGKARELLGSEPVVTMDEQLKNCIRMNSECLSAMVRVLRCIMNKTKVDDMLMEMIQPKVDEIEKKFTSGEGLTQEDINTLLLKSQYNHINHLDQKLNEVTADVASLKGEFSGLKGEFSELKGEFSGLRGEFSGLRGEFKLLETRVDERLNTLEANMARFEMNISLKISEAINTNMRFSIGSIVLIVTMLKLADMFMK